jgi:3-methyladenine DNA glycosylase AlkD
MTAKGDVVAATAESVLVRLRELADPAEFEKIAKRVDPSQVIGVRMKYQFDLARAESAMELTEVRELLRSPWYEARMVAVSILDARARRSSPDSDERRKLYEMYLQEHNHIDTWDLIDRAAPHVIGEYLLLRSRAVLFALAGSDNQWERRTAVTAAFWIIRAGDLDDPIALVDVLLDDDERFVQTSVGVALREIGRVDRARRDDYLARNRHRVSPVTRRLMNERPATK